MIWQFDKCSEDQKVRPLWGEAILRETWRRRWSEDEISEESLLSIGEDMKRYTVARFFWLTIALLMFSGVDLVFGLINLRWEDGYGAMLAWTILAVLCALGAAFLIWRGEWISRIEVKPFEETMEYIHLAKGVNYAIKEELVRKKRLVARLKENQKGMLKKFISGSALTTIGSLTFGFSALGVNLSDMEHVYQSFVGLTYPGLALGSVLLVLGGCIMWNAFLNSEISFAYWIAEKFTIDTYGIRIQRETILIGILSKRLEKEKEDEKRRREEFLQQEKEKMEKIALIISDDIELRG